MLNLKTKKTDHEGYYETTLVVDTGTTVISIDYGIMHENDLEVFSYDIAAEAEKTLKKLGRL